MVTVNQFARGVGRTLRAMERDAQRAQRQQLVHQRAMDREAALDAAADFAQASEEQLRKLTGAHRRNFTRIDWVAIAGEPSPLAPVATNDREERAIQTLHAYHPGWFARTLGFADKKRAKLSSAVSQARQEDFQEFTSRCERAKARRLEIEFAKSVVRLESSALVSAIDKSAELENAPVEGINVLVADGRLIAVINGFELDDMPTRSVVLLQSGKASVKPLSAGKINEIHRDNICSAAIRVAAEFLRVVPVEAVEVLVEVDLLDRGSGHIKPQPVLYARITAQAMGAVNLSMADPAPLAELLGAHIQWNKRDGLRPIDIGRFNLPQDLLED